MTAFYNFLITGGSLSTNTAVNGGGAYVASSGSLTVSGGTMNGNTAARGTEGSAAIYAEGSSGESFAEVSVVNGRIRDKRAAGFGAAVYLQGYSKLHVSGGTTSGNAATEANGGAVNVEPSHTGIYLSGRPSIFNNPGNTTTLFTSGANGIYFIDMMPYGTCYLYERTAPEGYAAGKWFILDIRADGLTCREAGAEDISRLKLTPNS